MLPIYITTCPKYEYLVSTFLKLVAKYWGRQNEIKIHYAKENEPWSTQAIRLLEEIKSKHFIWLLEEFFLIDNVRVELLKDLENYVMKHPEISRIGLQSRYDGFENCSKPYEILDKQQLYQLNYDAEYILSLEASIFKKETLLKYMVPGQTPWDAEVDICRKAIKEKELVLLTQDTVIPYKDALRRGGSAIHAKDMNLAMICRFDNSGLGTLSWEFARNLRPHKILLVENGLFQTFPERYEKFNTSKVPAHSTISKEYRDWLFEDTDIILSIETFYTWGIVPLANEVGIKTVLITMYEMFPEIIPAKPDLFICPSKLDFQVIPDPKIYIPIPLNTERLKWRKRTKAELFIHTASHGGVSGRKGTQLLLAAMRYVKSDIKLIIYTWKEISSIDKKVVIKKINFQNYWQIWRKGDVLVYPQDYNGICLPVQEAFASGLGVISTDIFPFNKYLPKKLLFKPDHFYKTRADAGLLEIKAAKINPQKIAEKIDEIAGKNILEYSLQGLEWGIQNSWKVLLPQYIKVLKELCQNQKK